MVDLIKMFRDWLRPRKQANPTRYYRLKHEIYRWRSGFLVGGPCDPRFPPGTILILDDENDQQYLVLEVEWLPGDHFKARVKKV